MKKNSNKFNIDLFGDGMRVFLNYIIRQLKKDPRYKPHPLIRALECALQGVEKLKTGECTMGYSCEGSKKSVVSPYLVVLRKKSRGIEIKEIRNLIIDKNLPTDVMIIIFRLQIKLDKLPGKKVNPQQMVDALNEVIPDKPFCAIGDRWVEARDAFRVLIEQGKASMPPNDKLKEELLAIKYDTKWEDYGKNARATIGTSIIEKFEGCKFMITSPKDSQIEKGRVFDTALEYLIGRTSEYMNPSKDTG